MKITLSKSQWEVIGNKAGWMKTAQPITQPLESENVVQKIPYVILVDLRTQYSGEANSEEEAKEEIENACGENLSKNKDSSIIGLYYSPKDNTTYEYTVWLGYYQEYAGAGQQSYSKSDWTSHPGENIKSVIRKIHEDEADKIAQEARENYLSNLEKSQNSDDEVDEVDWEPPGGDDHGY